MCCECHYQIFLLLFQVYLFKSFRESKEGFVDKIGAHFSAKLWERVSKLLEPTSLE